MIPESERRILFHGWAFEEKRSSQQKEALRYWMNTGERDDQNLHYDDLVKIQKAEGKG